MELLQSVPALSRLFVSMTVGNVNVTSLGLPTYVSRVVSALVGAIKAVGSTEQPSLTST